MTELLNSPPGWCPHRPRREGYYQDYPFGVRRPHRYIHAGSDLVQRETSLTRLLGVNGAIQSHPRTDITRRIPTYPGGPVFFHDSDGVQDVQMTDLYGSPWYLCRLKGADPRRRFVEPDADVRRSAILTPLQFDPGLFPNYAPWHVLALESDILAGRYGLAGWDGLGYDSSIIVPDAGWLGDIMQWWDELDYWQRYALGTIGIAAVAGITIATFPVSGVAWLAIGSAALFSAGMAAHEYGRYRTDTYGAGDTVGRQFQVYGKVGMGAGALGVAAPWMAAGMGHMVAGASAISPTLGTGVQLGFVGLGGYGLVSQGRSMYNDWGEMDWLDWVDRHGVNAVMMVGAVAYGGYRLGQFSIGKGGPLRNLKAWQLHRGRQLVTRWRGTEHLSDIRALQKGWLQSPAQRVGVDVKVARTRLGRFIQMVRHTKHSGKPLSPFVSITRELRTAENFGYVYEFEIRRMDITRAWWNWFLEAEDLAVGGTKILNVRRLV